MTALRPEDRYGSFRDLIQDIERASAGRELAVPPPRAPLKWPPEKRPPVKRTGGGVWRKWVIGAAACLFLALTACAGLLLVSRTRSLGQTRSGASAVLQPLRIAALPPRLRPPSAELKSIPASYGIGWRA